jgi:hypothetical protein
VPPKASKIGVGGRSSKVALDEPQPGIRRDTIKNLFDLKL